MGSLKKDGVGKENVVFTEEVYDDFLAKPLFDGETFIDERKGNHVGYGLL